MNEDKIDFPQGESIVTGAGITRFEDSQPLQLPDEHIVISSGHETPIEESWREEYSRLREWLDENERDEQIDEDVVSWEREIQRAAQRRTIEIAQRRAMILEATEGTWNCSQCRRNLPDPENWVVATRRSRNRVLCSPRCHRCYYRTLRQFLKIRENHGPEVAREDVGRVPILELPITPYRFMFAVTLPEPGREAVRWRMNGADVRDWRNVKSFSLRDLAGLCGWSLRYQQLIEDNAIVSQYNYDALTSALGIRPVAERIEEPMRYCIAHRPMQRLRREADVSATFIADAMKMSVANVQVCLRGERALTGENVVALLSEFNALKIGTADRIGDTVFQIPNSENAKTIY